MGWIGRLTSMFKHRDLYTHTAAASVPMARCEAWSMI
jgi:hypothetical protein